MITCFNLTNICKVLLLATVTDNSEQKPTSVPHQGYKKLTQNSAQAGKAQGSTSAAVLCRTK